MNPFVSHHILNDLPYELMKQPNKAEIERFVEKKRQKILRHSAISGIIGVILLLINIMLLKPELGPILNFINLWFWFVMGAILFRKAKSINLREGELDELLKSFSQGGQKSA